MAPGKYLQQMWYLCVQKLSFFFWLIVKLFSSVITAAAYAKKKVSRRKAFFFHRRTTGLFWRWFLIFVLLSKWRRCRACYLTINKWKRSRKVSHQLSLAFCTSAYTLLNPSLSRPAKISGMPGRGFPLLNIQPSGFSQDKTLNI